MAPAIGCLDRVVSHHTASTRVPLLTSSVSGSHRHAHGICSAARKLETSMYRPRSVRALSAVEPSTAQATTEAGKDEPYGSVVTGCVPCMEGTTLGVINEDNVVTKFIAETLLPTKHGKFRLRGYKHSIDGGLTFTEPTAIIYGQVEGRENVVVRVHDACYTSEVLGSLKCDCAEQLQLALKKIQELEPGMVIYLQQEGRGIGLANKIAAYSLQEQGLDTVDANRALGLPDDCREYTSVRNILRELGVKSVRLLTNNPRKINQLTKLGIPITGREPCVVEAGEYNLGYLETKRDRMDHLLPEEVELNGQFCFWNHDGEPRAQPSASMDSNGGMGLPKGATVNAGGMVVVDIPSNGAGTVVKSN